jgi:hypothetical protein
MTLALRSSLGAEGAFARGLYACAWLVATLSASTGCVLFWTQVPPLRVVGIVAAAAGLLSVFAARTRIVMGDLIASLTAQERMALIVLAAMAALAPRLVYGPPGLALGLVVLHAPALLGTAREPGFARLYVLAGVTLVHASLVLGDAVALALWTLYFILVCVGMAFERWFFALAASPDTEIAASPMAALRTGGARFAVAAGITLPLALFTPRFTPIAEVAARNPRRGDGFVSLAPRALEEISFRWYAEGLLLVAMMLLTVWLIKLVRRLRRRFKAPPPESIGVPVAAPEVVRRARAAARARRDLGPRERIAALYEELSDGLAKENVGRPASQTPREYLARMETAGVPPAPLAGEITRLFERARYGPDEVTDGDAQAFAERVGRALRAKPENAG